ncbi:DUF1326 domain-containing protein [Paraburkholderia sp. DD10]|jgi:hypothetical protein|uniref:DUF1326 domain-containing protein n=2 Tax=Burkholderiaceae TaxID=119060 RepID=A0A1M6M334_9BURK|nr:MULTISPECIES: DUF1326 domain-containing protein [Paraburkholderia]ORC49709.1 hypothetical protein B2G74_17280 [Burkholderia sp. A27]AXE92637.1 DUF1326 domain-containing protein [Paraburkholderia terricola]MDR6411450.1 hypothetical protein [Paraburkholderia terricola]MDR6483613.1 hypothetical protein [Paraburkholderia terricola]SDN94441.1 hypothetical protein SAMN05192547_1006155 [Paraburkholderia sediminicola]
MAESWKVAGTYFESCNCYAPCSCVCLGPPSDGDCAALIGWHVDQGEFAGVTLDGLNIALFAYAPGHMLQNKWRVALYLDERGTPKQQEALGQIFSGQAGGPLSALGPMIGEVMGVKPVAIDYQLDGKRRSLRIPDIADMEIEALSGQDGGDVTISNHPLTPVPGFAAVIGKSTRFRFTDHGFSREISDRNGFYSPFAYHG